MPDVQNRKSADNAHRFAPAAPDEDAVYGACCPGWHSAAGHDDALDDWIRFMRERGVERVCCLLPGEQRSGSGTNVARYRRSFGDDRVLHAPIPDQTLADEALLTDDVLPFFDAAVAADEPVVAHGLAGICRTGQVLAAWLAHDRGYGPERAIAAVESTGRLPTDAVRSGDEGEGELHDLLASVD